MSAAQEGQPFGRAQGPRVEGSARPVVVLDANVLYPAQLRDLLMRLAVAGLIRVHWTDEIHEEWTRAVRERHPDLAPEQFARTRTLMERALPAARVTGYRRRLKQVTLPDPDDRHVVAAALKAGASTIVTFNVRDFPAEALAPHGLEAFHPDDFVRALYVAEPERVVEVARRHRATLRRPPLTVTEYLAALRRAGLGQTVEVLRAHRSQL